MRYGSLRKQGVKSFKIPALDGGINPDLPCENIKDNELVSCKNMWQKGGKLTTRPGLKGDIEGAYMPTVYGYTGKLKYNITDTEIYIDNVYYKIATADIATDDYAHYTYVYLIDSQNVITPIGNMAFLRLSSDNFFVPENILFFSGKAQTGGGIFAFVTLYNQYDYTKKNYYIYEVSKDYSEWQRVYDYYTPTIYINGRGNRYQTAEANLGISLPKPKTLETQNMLNGRFHAYYSADGHSTTFKLPFTKLADERIICRIYYTLVDYAEWEIPADDTASSIEFFGEKVSAVIDRERGAIYFVGEDGEFPVPLMDLYPENNMRITATKEIEDGFCRIVHSTCSQRYNTKLLVSGGMDGNTVFASDFDNPLYFPLASSVNVGESDNEVVAFSLHEGRVVAFKKHSVYLLDIKNGSDINEISLLSDNDKIFKNNDTFNCKQLNKMIGCVDRKTVAICGNKNLWLGTGNLVYCLSGNKIEPVSTYPATIITSEDDYDDIFAIGDEMHYIIVVNGKVIVFEIGDKQGLYLWYPPENAKIDSGFYSDGKLRFLCTDKDSKVVFVATLYGDSDTLLYCENDELKQQEIPVESHFSTKHYGIGGFSRFKSIDEIYLLLSARGRVKISINGKREEEINFGFQNENFSNNDYKLTRLLPHLHGVNTVYLDFSSNHPMSIGEIEIFYRITG